jgi:hypothetical protein
MPRRQAIKGSKAKQPFAIARPVRAGSHLGELAGSEDWVRTLAVITTAANEWRYT